MKKILSALPYSRIRTVSWYTLAFVILTVPSAVFAEHGGITHGGGETPGLTNPLHAETLESFIEGAVEVARNIGFLVAVIFIVYAGFMFVTAQGNEDKLKKARLALLWALVGTGVLLGAWLLATTLQDTVQSLQ